MATSYRRYSSQIVSISKNRYNSSVFATEEQTARLANFFREKGLKILYRKNDLIVKPGETPPGVFYILEGIVKSYDVTRYGDENLLIIRKAHEFFPLIWTITGQERNIAYRALVPTTMLRVTREDFVDFLKQDSELLAPFIDMTMEMYRLHSERILNLEYRSVRERIASFLLTTAQRFGTQTDEGIRIEMPLRHQDIASSINASRETTSRELARMQRKGMVGKDFSRLVLLDPNALRAYLKRP